MSKFYEVARFTDSYDKEGRLYERTEDYISVRFPNGRKRKVMLKRNVVKKG